MNPIEVELAEVFEQRLNGEEPHAGWGGAEMLDPRQAMFSVLDAHAPPDVQLIGGIAELGLEHVAQALGALRQDLIRVPVRCLHDADDGENVLVGYVLVEQVAHRVDEDHLRLRPAQRLGKFLWDQAEIEPLLVGMPWHAAEPLGESLGIAMSAAGADLGAAADRVPGCVGPFDLGFVAHSPLPCLVYSTSVHILAANFLEC